MRFKCRRPSPVRHGGVDREAATSSSGGLCSDTQKPEPPTARTLLGAAAANEPASLGGPSLSPAETPEFPMTWWEDTHRDETLRRPEQTCLRHDRPRLGIGGGSVSHGWRRQVTQRRQADRTTGKRPSTSLMGASRAVGLNGAAWAPAVLLRVFRSQVVGTSCSRCPVRFEGTRPNGPPGPTCRNKSATDCAQSPTTLTS